MSKDYQYRVILKDLSQFSTAYLIPLADWHVGCGGTDLDVIQGYIDWIKNHANAYTILNGDLMNCAGKDTSPELFEDLCTPDTAYEKVREMLRPIKNRILMITRGNHEETIFRKVGADYMARLAYDLGDVPYKPNGGMLGMRLKKNLHYNMCWAYATHGWGGARTIGAKVKKADDLTLVADADIYVVSHDHTQAIHRANVLNPPRSRVSCERDCYMTIRRKLLINTGGFIKYSGYIQRKGYVPQDLGTPRIRIEAKHPDQGYELDLHASM